MSSMNSNMQLDLAASDLLLGQRLLHCTDDHQLVRQTWLMLCVKQLCCPHTTTSYDAIHQSHLRV
jgi:hypothetical protein